MISQEEHPQSGFTLIEVMVASLILGLSLIAIINMLTMGLTFEAMDGLRRQARTIVASTLESPAYQSYVPGAESHSSSIGVLRTSIGVPIPYTLTVDITSPAAASWTDGDAPPAIIANSVPFNLVAVNISWLDAGRTETFGLEKMLAQ